MGVVVMGVVIDVLPTHHQVTPLKLGRYPRVYFPPTCSHSITSRGSSCTNGSFSSPGGIQSRPNSYPSTCLICLLPTNALYHHLLPPLLPPYYYPSHITPSLLLLPSLPPIITPHTSYYYPSHITPSLLLLPSSYYPLPPIITLLILPPSLLLLPSSYSPLPQDCPSRPPAPDRAHVSVPQHPPLRRGHHILRSPGPLRARRHAAQQGRGTADDPRADPRLWVSL